MRHYRSLDELSLGGSSLSIGTFDGVHLGHQEIIRQLVARAHQRGVPAVVVTFFPHPDRVLGKKEGRFYLSTPEERAELLGGLGVDVVLTYPFDVSTANLTAREFLVVLKQRISFRDLVVGYDFALGRNREGTVERLLSLGKELGYDLQVVPPVQVGGEVVSSSLLRTLLSEGNIKKVNQLLGRPFRLSGTVIKGDGRGRTLGIPTANLDILAERVVPLQGVYVCHACVNHQRYGAVVNVGIRPTFEEDPVAPRVEAHLLDFDADLYQETLALEFLDRLRDERRFPSKEALVEQIRQDISQARRILSSIVIG
ncbi:MAG: bifunctional riboflavin kinase/FAD synthetase [Anaerolineales bacterium]|nr:bifunctional riboflavin kinase/FAD synthetase [Anaerolineales bacterium]MCS7246804.1 bifunctional riboflavin kinase/FAD synthetase [Anaerolineales bacterium]MDW8160614.1 bifunctional riboflavin kinase/FAD synthetase [Anaerolineales bacterium]MDW8447592.1 bifunctional riboflavin kinase/FAD synthetase [Anaerolineales bacterium]